MIYIKTKITEIIETLSPSGTSIFLKEFKTSNGVDIDYQNDYNNTPFNITIVYGDKSETIKINNIIRNSNGRVELKIAPNGRNLKDKPPFTGSAVGNNFLIGAKVFTSNDPNSLDQLSKKDSDNTIDGKQTFNGEIIYNGLTSNPKNPITREVFDSIVLQNSGIALISHSSVAGENLAQNKIIKYNSTDGKWYNADKDDSDISVNTVFGFIKTAYNINQTITDGVVIVGKTTLGGLTTGLAYLGDNGSVASSGNIIIGRVEQDGVLRIDNKTVYQNLLDAQKGSAGIPSDNNRFITENSLSNGASYTANTVAFVDSNPDTITDSANGFITAGFKKGQEIIITGSASNNNTFRIDTVSAGTITLTTDDSLTAENAGQNITIATKNNNNVVQFNNQGSLPAINNLSFKKLKASDNQKYIDTNTIFYSTFQIERFPDIVMNGNCKQAVVVGSGTIKIKITTHTYGANAIPVIMVNGVITNWLAVLNNGNVRTDTIILTLEKDINIITYSCKNYGGGTSNNSLGNFEILFDVLEENSEFKRVS